MTEKTSHPTTDSSIMQQLTAYLDGELDATDSSGVEERLATDEKYRSLMQKLQRTWDILDVLPTASASHSFTQSTMKLIVDDIRKLNPRARRSYWTWPLRILALIMIPAIASAGTFLASRYVQSVPNGKLISNLPVIRNLEVLNCDRNLSIEFLQQLAREGDLFGIALQSTLENESLKLNESGREIFDDLNLLPTAQKDRIRNNRDNFEALSLADKTRIRRLHADLLQQPEFQQLQSVLLRYATWLRTLSETDSATIRDTIGTADRIATIKRITEEQFYANFGRTGRMELPAEDAQKVYLGFLDLIQNNRKVRQMRDAISLEQNIMISLDARSRQLADEQQTIYVGGRRLQIIYDQYPEKIDDIINAADVLRIRLLLSEEALAGIDFAINWQKGNQIRSEAQLLVSWMLTVFDARFNPATPKTLQEFYNSLPTDKKDRIDNEFPEHRMQQLKELYNERLNVLLN